MIEKFQYYLDSGLVKKTSPNPDSAAALIGRAEARLAYVREQQIGRANAPFIFEDAYEVIREASQALMELKGYKPYSHEAQISFLREFCSFSDYLVSAFDRLRVLRNKCVYGAAQISPETCREALGFAASILPELKKRFKEESEK